TRSDAVRSDRAAGTDADAAGRARPAPGLGGGVIEINLLPGSGKRSSKRPKRGGRSKKGASPASRPSRPEFDKSRLMAVGGWVIGIAIVAWLHVSMTSRLEALATDHEAAVRDSARYAALRAQGDSLLAQEQLIGQKLQV